MRAFKNIGLIATGVIIGLTFVGPAQMSEAAPGTEELDVYLESKLSEVPEVSAVTSSASLFEIVEVKAGGMIYLGDSTEFILRSGEGLAIASTNGGLADLTEGNDIAHSKSVPKNHQILNPQNDGRGVAITVDAWVMIKGAYTIVPKN